MTDVPNIKNPWCGFEPNYSADFDPSDRHANVQADGTSVNSRQGQYRAPP